MARQQQPIFGPGTPPLAGSGPDAPDEWLAPQREWVLPAVGLLLLHLSHPLTWRCPVPGWWFPPVGLGIALVAWLGPRATVLIAADALLVAAQAYFTRTPVGWPDGPARALGAGWEAFLLAFECLAAWGVYHHWARGSRRLGDPSSATIFLILVPSLVAGVFALLSSFPAWLLDADRMPGLGERIGQTWLSHALGILTVTPPLLATLTPWLVRRRLALAEPPLHPRDSVPIRQLTTGDCLEIGGLALGTAILGGMQALIHYNIPSDPGLASWQLWGLPLLVIVWTSLRQGLRGGTVVATAAVGLPLLRFGFFRPVVPPDPFWQANMLAQCSTALLAAAAANWIRLSETRYRQVVTRIPVVLYSARVVKPTPEGTPPVAELTFVSPAARTLLGTEPEELLGDYNRWLALVHAEDQEVLLAAIAQLGRQTQPVVCEYRLAPCEAGPPDSRPVRTALQTALTATYGSRVMSAPTAPARQRCVRDTLAPTFGPSGELEGWDGVVSDITEQRALADDLRRTTSMFHALVAHLPAGVFFVQGAAGRPILVNARARHLLGQREDLGVGLDQLVEVYRLCRADGTPYPTDELPVVTALRRGVSSMRDDIVVHRPDGRRVPLVTWATPIDLGGQGSHDAAVWVFEDLTPLQQAEAARRESEARLRTVIGTMAEGVVVIDAQGIIIECNPAASDILGRGPEQIRGLSCFDPGWKCLAEDGSLLPPEAYPASVSLREGRPIRNVVLGIPLPGREELRWLLVNAMPLPVPRPEPKAARVVTTFADITAYRQALEVVRASEEKYRELVETLPIMLVQFDAGGRVTYMNPAARTTTGYNNDDLRAGDALPALILADDLPRVHEAFAAALDGQTIRLEARYRAKDGAEKVGYVILDPRQSSAGPAVAALVVDMTRERQLEQELQRAQRLELIGRLSSGIAHDFNNLLTVVLALAEVARDSVPPEHPVRDDLRRIAQAGEQAANLAHQLLAFSKNRRVMPTRIDVNRVTRRTLELLRATLPRFIHIEAGLADGDLPVMADEMQVQQVLINLCLNARDAMPQGGRLAVRTEQSSDGNGHADAAVAGWVRLTVEDDGEGIPEDMQARIFDAFFSTKERGTGLGLAMVRQIVEGFGGRVEVASRVGEGSRFDVWLPLVHASEEV